MERSRGSRNGWKWMAQGLKVLYGRWVGELDWIENPPKSMRRKWRGRDAFLEGADDRARRAEQIKDALPHILYVIRLLDPDWGPEMAKPVRPRKAPMPAPPLGWAEAALNVLRDAADYLSVSEIVDEIAERHDEVDLSVVGARQNAQIAVSATLLKSYRRLLVEDPRGNRWALASRVASFSA